MSYDSWVMCPGNPWYPHRPAFCLGFTATIGHQRHQHPSVLLHSKLCLLSSPAVELELAPRQNREQTSKSSDGHEGMGTCGHIEHVRTAGKGNMFFLSKT